MNNLDMHRPSRTSTTGWKTIDRADNGVEILEHKINVENFDQAVKIANKIAPLVMKYESSDNEYTLRLNLSRWIVEARLSVPADYWESDEQEKLAKNIAKIAHA